MGLSFVERMQGNLIDERGDAHFAVFEIQADATHLQRFAVDGKARIRGVVRARPWAEEAPLEGSLRISLIKDRCIEYDFHFTGEDEELHRFYGIKHLSAFSPIKGATTLYSTISKGDDELAKGTMYFDMNDAGAFARSWRLRDGFNRVNLGQGGLDGAPGPSPLSSEDIETLRAIAEILIVPGKHVPEVDEETIEAALQVLSHLPDHLRSLYRVGLDAIDALSRARTLHRFSRLDRDGRRRMLEQLDQQRPAGNALVLLLGMPIKAAHFSRRDYLDSLGFPSYDNPVGEPPPRYMSNHIPAEDLEPETDIPCDVVVVGSGAGGAPVAALLAEKGLAVAVVEEGVFAQRHDFAGDPRKRLLKFWRDAGLVLTKGNPPISIPVGSMVGGSTAINSGTCFRTPGDVLDGWRTQFGLPEEISSEGLDPFFASVERELGVEPGGRPYLGHIAKVVAKGAEEMGKEHYPLPRNAPGCDGQGLCVFGCPTEAKRSTNISYIPRAMKAGASVFTGLPVTTILRRGNKVIGIEARGSDRKGVTKRLRIRAQAVVLACGTLHTPVLLMRNGIDLPWLGRNLSCHPALGMFAMVPERSTPWNAIPQSYGVHDLVDKRIKFEGFYAPPQLSAPVMPMIGSELTRWMDAQDHLIQYGFMVKDPNPGSVRPGPNGQPSIRYDIDAPTRKLFQRGAAALAELLLRGGATEVLTGLGPIGIVRSIGEAQRILDFPLKPYHLRLMGFHPLGTCRMGSDPDNSVVDSDQRVHGFENLYISDGSTVPTSLGVNPQITIMAFAERLAGRISHKFSV